MITGIANIHFYVQDMDKAVAFYTVAFGAEFLNGDEHWSRLRVDGLDLGLHGCDGHPVVKRDHDINGVKGGVTLALKSNDIAADRASLERLGAKILHESKADWGHMMIFEDLDGNVLNLVHEAI